MLTRNASAQTALRAVPMDVGQRLPLGVGNAADTSGRAGRAPALRQAVDHIRVHREVHPALVGAHRDLPARPARDFTGIDRDVQIVEHDVPPRSLRGDAAPQRVGPGEGGVVRGTDAGGRPAGGIPDVPAGEAVTAEEARARTPGPVSPETVP